MPNDKLPSGVMYHVIPDTRTTAQVLADLCQAFRAKTGQWPKTVWAHPQTLGDFASPNGLEIKTITNMLRNHYLVGPLPADKNNLGG
jgi:hypothetical protein